jgi:hypothetical protein
MTSYEMISCGADALLLHTCCCINLQISTEPRPSSLSLMRRLLIALSHTSRRVSQGSRTQMSLTVLC